MNSITLADDTVQPRILVHNLLADSNDPETFYDQIYFSEPVQILDIDDFEVINALITGFVLHSANSYLLTLVPLEAGQDVTVSLKPESVLDVSGNPVDIENSIPSLDQSRLFNPGDDFISTPDTPEINESRGESISGIADPDTTIKLYLINSQGDTEEAEVQSDRFGQWQYSPSISLQHGDTVYAEAIDQRGNTSETRATINVDQEALEIAVIEESPDTINNTDNFDMLVRFDEQVQDANAGDFSVENGSVIQVSLVESVDGGSLYRLTITPDGTGDVQISARNGAIHDLAGNAMAGSTLKIVDYSASAPVVMDSIPSFIDGELVWANTSDIDLSFGSSGDRYPDFWEHPLFDYDQTFKLNSNPDAQVTIYLDFDGFIAQGHSYLSDGSVITPPSRDDDDTTFSEQDLMYIQLAWAQAVEFFAPFNVNITTEEPDPEMLTRDSEHDPYYGIVLAHGTGGNDEASGSIGEFDETPYGVTVSETDPDLSGDSFLIGSTLAHEVGHNLGLFHKFNGKEPGNTASYGGGFMASNTGYGWTVRATGQNNQDRVQDDLYVITTQNGLGFRADEVGDTFDTASELGMQGQNFAQYGIIEQNTDIDMFHFSVSGTQSLNLTVAAVWDRTLAVEAVLYNGNGELVAVLSPGFNGQNALFNRTLSEGDYYLSVDGAERYTDNSQLNYSDYGSLGQYTVTGTLQDTDDTPSQNTGTTMLASSVADDVIFIRPEQGSVFNILQNDSIASGSRLVLSNLIEPEHGTLVILDNGWVQYKPDAGYLGPDSFTYTIPGSNGQAQTATVTLQVGNQAAIARNDYFIDSDAESYDENYDYDFYKQDNYSGSDQTKHDAIAARVVTQHHKSVLENDTDPEYDNLTVLGIKEGSGPLHGSVTIDSSGYFTYEPDADFVGEDSFTYLVTDKRSGVVSEATAVVQVKNYAPDTQNDNFQVDEDRSLLIENVLANDTDKNNDSFNITGFSEASKGTVKHLGDGSFRYVPDENASGKDSFTYTVQDSSGQISTATVTVNIKGSNDAPVISDAELDVDNSEAFTFDPLLNVNDPDGESDSLSVLSISYPETGQLLPMENGQFQYIPESGFVGDITLDYVVSDAAGALAAGKVTLQVKNLNDNPEASDDTFETIEDTPVVIDVLANDQDIDGDSLHIQPDSIVINEAHGSVMVNTDNTLTFNPAENHFGPVNFTYVVADGRGGEGRGNNRKCYCRYHS